VHARGGIEVGVTVTSAHSRAGLT